MADIADLERRISRLEAAQNDNTGTLKWIAEQVGKSAGDITVLKDDVKALNGKVEKVEADISDMRKEFRGDIAGLRREFKDFQTSLPSMIGDVMREVLKAGRTDG
jgi:hypothetical protein